MKTIKKLLFSLILGLMLFPVIVNAASASFSVSGPNQGVVGNNISITVTVSSSQALGGWELALNYDKSYLQLSSAPDGANGTHVAGNATSSGTKSKQYRYTFKVLKSGSTTISTTSTDAYGWDESSLSCSNGSKKIVLKTQAEIEASYSANDNLKNLTVDNYSLSPSFDKNTLEYSLEVENDVEKVNISAIREDNTASVSGAGEKELTEGGNKFNIVVTAQKGNSKTYVINITRKELNPITVNVNNKSYTLVRKKDLLPSLNTFVETTVNYDGEEIPGLKNETINYTLIGLKDADGNIGLFVYNDNKITDEYFELTSGSITILPKSIDVIKGLTKKEVNIKGHVITGCTLSASNSFIIKGVNVYTGEESYYMYDKVNEIFIAYDKTNIEQLLKKYNMFKIGGIALAIVVVLLIVLIIISKFTGSKKEKKNKKDVIDQIDDYEEEVKNEEPVKEEVVEEIKEDQPVEEVKEDKKEEKISKKAQKKLVKEEKRKKREQEELEKTKAIEKVEEEVIEEDDEVDDPLNADDDFVDFWETREYKVKDKKKE
ncbi:MAG: cadherin-like beta sandwich domain-containing protein [Bacilli bacterium]|nr:cadherin-like beta sandwich domain-containing protein [Bacilli bacterium]